MHEIAAEMLRLYPETLDFLEQNVIKGIRKNTDALVSDPSIIAPDWARGGYKKIYGNQAVSLSTASSTSRATRGL